jgi:hypothetical protein
VARFRIDLQAAKNISGDDRQPGNEAARIGGALRGVAFLNVFKIQSSGVVTFSIETASDLTLGDGTSGNFWKSAGSIVVPTTGSSVQQIQIDNLGEAIRWKASGVTSEFAFSCVAYLTDQ